MSHRGRRATDGRHHEADRTGATDSASGHGASLPSPRFAAGQAWGGFLGTDERNNPWWPDRPLEALDGSSHIHPGSLVALSTVAAVAATVLVAAPAQAAPTGYVEMT